MASNRSQALRGLFAQILWSAAFVASNGAAEPATSVPRVLVQVQRVSWGKNEDIRGGLLTREMVRQGVLIACRDQLGLATADAVLDESLPVDPAARSATLSVVVKTPASDRLQVVLMRADVKPPRAILTKEYEYNQDARYIYHSLAKALAPEIRATWEPALRAALPDVPLPSASERANEAPQLERIEQLLHEMNFTSQLVAVRLAHDQGRQRHVPAVYGALARGYAHLALLTQQHRDAAPQAFAARALLYSELECTGASDAPDSLANRIYVQAIVGLHDMSLRGLAELQKVDPKFRSLDPAAVNRLDIAGAYCRFDRAALKTASGIYPELASLATVLRARAADGIGDERVLLEATDAALDAAPEAYCLYPPLEYRGSLGVVRAAASGALRRLHKSLVARMSKLEELPAEVRGTAANALPVGGEEGEGSTQQLFPPALRELADVLARTAPADAGEPSWEALAGLVKEELFVNSAWYLEVVNGGVPIGKGEEVAAIRPLVAGHRYESYIASFAFDRDSQWEEYHNSLKPLRLVDLRPTMRRMYSRLWTVSFPHRELIGQFAFEATIRQRSFTADEMSAVIRQAEPDLESSSFMKNEFPRLLAQLPKISPHHPIALRAKIATAYEPSAEQLAAWEASVQFEPRALVVLGAKYHELKQYDAAIRCYEQSIAVSPAPAAFEALAAAHRAAGREDKWLASLKRYLRVEDVGLGHAHIRDTIARDMLARGRGAEAEKYARDAAGSGAAWALTTASEACERLEKWDDSEAYIRRLSQSYDGANCALWYFWCRRTGHGAVDDAERVARQYIDSERSSRDFYGPQTLMVYQMLADRPKDALEQAQSYSQRDDKSYWGPVHTALLAAELGDDKLASKSLASKSLAVLKAAHSSEGPKAARPDRAAMLIVLEQMTAKDPASPTMEQIDAVLDPSDPELRGDIAYFVGRACELHGNAEAAAHCYRRAVAECPPRVFNVTLAAYRLHAIEAKEKKS